jgi:hypothetical protein
MLLLQQSINCKARPPLGAAVDQRRKGAKNSLSVEREGNIWLRKAHVNEGDYPNIKGPF